MEPAKNSTAATENPTAKPTFAPLLRPARRGIMSHKGATYKLEMVHLSDSSIILLGLATQDRQIHSTPSASCRQAKAVMLVMQWCASGRGEICVILGLHKVKLLHMDYLDHYEKSRDLLVRGLHHRGPKSLMHCCKWRALFDFR